MLTYKAENQVKYYYRKKQINIGVGDRVMARFYRLRGEKWSPGTVTERKGEVIFEVKMKSSEIFRHANQLQKCKIQRTRT